jgi:thymidylate kinase
VAAGFAALAAAEPARYAVVDGTGASDEVHQRVLTVVTERLGTIQAP